MHLPIRPLALVIVCGVALLCSACSSNSSKIVGKWKMVSMTTKEGKEQSMEILGVSPVMEFTSDGNIKVGVDASNLPAEFKGKNPEAEAKMSEMKQVGKYKVSGDTIEFQGMEKAEDSPFGKNNKGKLKFDGDTLTISGDDGGFKLSRQK